MKEYNKIEQTPKDIRMKSEVEEVVEKEVQLQKAVTGQVKKAKKGLVERAVVAIIGPDGLPRVSKRVMGEIVGPSMRNMAFDALTNGLRMLILKDDYYNRPTDRYQGGWGHQQTDYGRAYSSRVTRATSPRKEETPSKYNPQAGMAAQQLAHGTIIHDYILETREDAQRVHDALRNSCYQYGKVKVANYYELIGIPTVYTDYNFGWLWDDIEHVHIRPGKGGYFLEFPPIASM